MLICVRQLDLIVVVDMEEACVVWALRGPWHKQHQPTALDNGNLLVFDNLGREYGSRVIEFDPISQRIAWCYEGDPPDAFFTRFCGSCQRLPNGNTLITESDPGRAFEVTPDKTIVWEYLNPHRAGEDDELIAALFEMLRLPPDFPVDWLGEAAPGESPQVP